MSATQLAEQTFITAAVESDLPNRVTHTKVLCNTRGCEERKELMEKRDLALDLFKSFKSGVTRKPNKPTPTPRVRTTRRP